jgi:hypothetical protein
MQGLGQLAVDGRLDRDEDTDAKGQDKQNRIHEHTLTGEAGNKRARL